MTTATLTLSSDGEGVDRLMLEIDYHGDFDPTSTVHNTVQYLGDMLEREAARAEAAANEPVQEKSRLILPEPPKKRPLILATNGGKRV